MKHIDIKTAEEIAVMAEAGRRLAMVRDELARAVKPGITKLKLERLADQLIKKQGGVASFKMVPGYYNATCISINEEVVHAIPKEVQIRSGDVVGIDVGLFYKGWHTDTAVTVVACGDKSKPTREIERFLNVGKEALAKAISKASPGNRVADISAAMQDTVEKAGYSAVKALTGHGVGRELHEEPAIPCFVVGEYKHSTILLEGMVIAIEVMYNQGTDEVVYKDRDGWTIITADGKISGLFEETVAVTKNGPVILTQVHTR